jgi:hypothetical protein
MFTFNSTNNLIKYFIFAGITLMMFACKNQGNNVTTKNINQAVYPAKKAGSIQIAGTNFKANAKSGYIFSYWSVVTFKSDTTYINDKTLHISADSVKKVAAHFAHIHFANTHGGYTSSYDGAYVYFISLWTDHANNSYWNIYQYNVETGEKKAIYTSAQPIEHLHISKDDNYLSFSSYNSKKNGNDHFNHIFDIQTRKDHTIAAGINGGWANNSDKFLSANQRGIYIYNARNSILKYISKRKFLYFYGKGTVLSDVEWAPNDKDILIGAVPEHRNDEFLYYSFPKQKIISKKVPGLSYGLFFGWINNSDFVVVGGLSNYKTVRYSLSDSGQVQKLPFKTNCNIAVSPNHKNIAYNQFGSTLSIFNIANDQSRNLIKNVYDRGGCIIWNNKNFILASRNSTTIIMVSYPDNSVNKI